MPALKQGGTAPSQAEAWGQSLPSPGAPEGRKASACGSWRERGWGWVGRKARLRQDLVGQGQTRVLTPREFEAGRQLFSILKKLTWQLWWWTELWVARLTWW